MGMGVNGVAVVPPDQRMELLSVIVPLAKPLSSILILSSRLPQLINLGSC